MDQGIKNNFVTFNLIILSNEQQIKHPVIIILVYNVLFSLQQSVVFLGEEKREISCWDFPYSLEKKISSVTFHENELHECALKNPHFLQKKLGKHSRMKKHSKFL